MTSVDSALGARLSSTLRGAVITRDSRNYDEARALFNAMIDRRPLLIAYPTDAAGVAAAVSFGRDEGLEIAVRCGAHNGAGLGSVDNGLVIDLSAVRGVEVDPGSRTARVLGGTLLGQVDAATHEHGLAAPFGIISTTGVGGLTLGGGVGHLTRTLGLSIDNLLGADVVLADGSQVRASEDENDDLFWALRGGGGNFGIVTSFTFRLSPISTVITGPMFWPLEQSAEVLSWYAEFMPEQPDKLNGFFAFLSVPPGDPFPAELHLQKVCAVVWCYAGSDETEAARLLEPARKLGPILDAVGPVPFPGIQSAFDGVYPPGDHWYWRADYVRDMPDASIQANVEYGSRMPTWKSSMHMYPIDGAAARMPSDATAWPARDARWAQVIIGVDPDPANADLIKQWTVDYWDAVHPYGMGGAYVNFMMEEGRDRIEATYGGNYARLATIKAKYDPDNLFHVNQNIRPAR
jgi:FAD/FMN-containing dehydrogenase